MNLKDLLFKPSTLIFILIIIIFITLAVVATKNPSANSSFFDISTDAIKILCGALAGAVAGEKYSEKVEKE